MLNWLKRKNVEQPKEEPEVLRFVKALFKKNNEPNVEKGDGYTYQTFDIVFDDDIRITVTFDEYKRKWSDLQIWSTENHVFLYWNDDKTEASAYLIEQLGLQKVIDEIFQKRNELEEKIKRKYLT